MKACFGIVLIGRENVKAHAMALFWHWCMFLRVSIRSLLNQGLVHTAISKLAANPGTHQTPVETLSEFAFAWTQHRSIVNVRRLEDIGEDASDDDPEGIGEVSEVSK